MTTGPTDYYGKPIDIDALLKGLKYPSAYEPRFGATQQKDGPFVERTGETAGCIAEFKATYPDGRTETFWSPPWILDKDGLEIFSDSVDLDRAARNEAQRRWEEKTATQPR